MDLRSRLALKARQRGMRREFLTHTVFKEKIFLLTRGLNCSPNELFYLFKGPFLHLNYVNPKKHVNERSYTLTSRTISYNILNTYASLSFKCLLSLVTSNLLIRTHICYTVKSNLRLSLPHTCI